MVGVLHGFVQRIQVFPHKGEILYLPEISFAEIFTI